jgi:AcrR family transcriptional regulator
MLSRGSDKQERPRPASPGRPRSDSVDRALAEAALEEFIARGYHAMSIESIAARAGVSKVSLYRRWRSKLAIATEVLRFLSKTASAIEDHGSLEADIRGLLKESIGSRSAKSVATIVMRMMGEISVDPELLALYRAHIIVPRLEQLRSLIERARARKELRANLSTDIACAMIAGPLFLCYLALLAEVEMPDNLADQLTRSILSGVT